MSIDRAWTMKPPVGVPLNDADPLCGGLMGFYALNEQGGPVAHDATHTLDLALAGFGSNPPWGSAGSGSGLVTSGYGTVGAQAPLPAPLRLNWPMSVACGVRIVGTPSNSGRIFGLMPVNTATAPFAALAFYTASATSVGFGFANGGTGVFPAAVPISQGVDYVLGLTVTPRSYAFYVNGSLVASGTGSFSKPAWTANAQVLAGGWTSVGGNSACSPLYWGGWWSRELSAGEHAAIGRDVNAIWGRLYRSRIRAAMSTVAPGILSATPSALFAGANTVAVVGFGTSWTPGSTTQFQLDSPPTGTSISSQTVADATHATVHVTAGSTAGSFRLDDKSGHTIAMAVAAGSFTVSPSVLPANHAGHLGLTLTGSGTAWASGTTFTLPSITGLSLVSKTWHSATSVTLVVSTGAGTGTGNITDSLDSDSAPLTVATETLAATPASVSESSTTPLDLTATNTVWSQETLSSLFTLSGIAGASISAVTLVSDGEATATLTIPADVSGTLTIRDASTGATAAVAVSDVPSGALHVAGPMVLQHTGGTTGTFGGQSAAWLAFRFRADSNAGLNLSAGTEVLSFATLAPGTSGYAVRYQPATGNLILQFFGAAGSGAAQQFVATVPVQVGTNYHFLVSWTNGAQVLYLNGLPYATAAVAANTYAYKNLQLGGFAGANPAGAPQAIDHTIADVAMGNGYVPTPAEALALAVGTTSPLQLATPAAAWWPLGGGTTGSHPVAADLTDAGGFLADVTGNGNTLSLATTTPAGALTNATYAAAITPLGSPLQVDAVVEKTGHLLVFHASGAGPINGVHPPATISALNADPTAIKRMGTPVQVGRAISFPAEGDSPDVFYELQCGGVQALAIPDGGAGYSAAANVTITPNNAGTGGSGLVLGTPVLQSGVTGYTPTNGGGAGYNQPPVLTITDAGGSGSGALGYCEMGPSGSNTWGVVGVRITAGGAGYVNPVATISGAASGSGAAVVLSQVGGVVQDNAYMTAFGSGYPASPAVTVSSPPNMGGPAGNRAAKARANVYGSDAAAWGGTPGAIREVLPLVGGLLGCGSGYTTATATVAAAPAGGTTATYAAVVSNYIADVPVTAPGQDYTRPPTFTISDSGGTPSRAAALKPMMTGAFAATLPGTTTSGSASVTGIPSTATLRVGHAVSGVGVPAGATIASVNGPNTVTLSAAATASGTPSLRFADAFTYDAPASWITATLNGFKNASTGAWTQGQPVGGLRAVSGAAVVNQAGLVETPVGGLLGFADTPTMLAGANNGAVPTSPGSTALIAKNYLHRARPAVLRNGGSLLLSADDTPVSWSPGGVMAWTATGATFGNAIDTMGAAAPYGTWTACWDDPQVNTANASAVVLASANDGPNLVVTPASLSGPSAPIAIPAANVTMNGNAIKSISLAGVSLGSGWQGAGIQTVPTGGGMATVTVAGGVPTAVNVVTGGSYAAGKPAVYLYGTLVSGTTVTAQFDYEYAATTAPGTGPAEWSTSTTFEVAQPQGLYNLVDPWLVAPDLRTRKGAAVPFDRSNPFVVDDGVLAVLTTPSGRGIGARRSMDSLGNYGGPTNYVNPQDVKDLSSLNWAKQATTTVNFSVARALNTDPGSPAYSWSSTKVYGPQAWAVQGPDAPFTITGTLTAGSTLVTNVSDMGLMVASSVSGAGVPAGATVAAVSQMFTCNMVSGSPVLTVYGDTGGLVAGMSAAGPKVPAGATILSVDGPNQVTLSAAGTGNGYQRVTAAGTPGTPTARFFLSEPATASGVKTLTVTTPGYVALPAADMGAFMPTSPANQYGIVELRSTLPHGFSSGVNPDLTGAVAVPFVTKSYAPGNPVAPVVGTTWVTGPYTVALAIYLGSGSGKAPQVVQSATELSVDWQLVLPTPPVGQATNYACEADFCRQLGCAFWLNLPEKASDALIRRIAADVAAHAGPTIPIHTEVGNELFTFPTMRSYFWPVQNLLQYLPAGTAVLDGTPDMIENVAQNTTQGIPGFQLVSGHLQDVFATAWAAAGGDPARLHRHVSGQLGNPNFAWAGLQIWQRAGHPCHHIHGAPYVSMPPDAPVSQAVAPAGSAMAAAGSLPIEGSNALFSYYINYRGVFWANWGADGAHCRAYGQPIEPVAIPATAPTPTSLAPGSYYVYYTFTDQAGGYGVGNETTVGLSQFGPYNVFSGVTPQVTMPGWPPWAQALNWYLGPGWAPGVCTFYQQVTRAQYASTYPLGSAFPFSAAMPSNLNQPPPATNGAAAHTAAVPTPTCYEGALQNPVNSILPAYVDLAHDSFLHPSAADAQRNFLLHEQRGNPTVPGSGVQLACYYSMFDQPQYPAVWMLAEGTSQMPGDGLGHAYAGSSTYGVAPNRFATIQGGYSADGVPPDGHDHFQFGTSPMLQAMRSWSDVASPAPGTPTPTPTATTPTITWDTPDPIAYGTPLDGTQLDATATANGSPVDGSFVYIPGAGVILPAGTSTLSVEFEPTDTTDFTSAAGAVFLTVVQATPTIAWPTPTPISAGTALADAQLDAQASIPGTYVYTPPFGTVLPLGTSTLSVAFTPADAANYTAATATVSIQVIPSPTPTPTATEYASTDPDAASMIALRTPDLTLAYADPDRATVISAT